MQNILDHYYLFTISDVQNGLYRLAARKGYYEPLERLENPLTDFVITYNANIRLSQRLHLLEEEMHSKPTELRGLAHLNNYQDCILLIQNIEHKSLELFVSEDCKGLSTFMFDLLNKNRFDSQLNELRHASKSSGKDKLFIKFS